MRLIGILLIVAGLYFAVAKPWFSTNLTGEKIATTQVYDKASTTKSNRGWEVSNVFLEKENSPAIIRINVSRLPGQFYSNAKLKLLVRVAPVSRDGTTKPPIVNEAVTVNLDTGKPENLIDKQPQVSVISTGQFNVPATGNYKIGAFPISGDNVNSGNSQLEIDPNIIGISAIVMFGVEPVAMSGTVFGGALIVAGLLLMSIGKRRRTHSSRPQNVPEVSTAGKKMETGAANVEKPPNSEIDIKQPPKTPKSNVGKTIQWGRDAGKKR